MDYFNIISPFLYSNNFGFRLIFICIDKTNDKHSDFIRNVKGENYGKDGNRCF